MNAKYIIRYSSVFLLFLFLVLPLQAEGNEYHYFDGSIKKTIYPVQDQFIAIKNDVKVPPGLTGATLLKQSGNAFIYKLNEGETLSGIRSKATGYKVSGVFTEGSDGKGQKLAFPGGVILKLDRSWNNEKCLTWLRSRKFQAISKLNLKGNYYRVDSPAGLESLKIANSLRDEAGVIYSIPDLWSEFSLR